MVESMHVLKTSVMGSRCWNEILAVNEIFEYEKD